MIGKPEWFMRRKYTGWGVNPKTWQGWVYLAAVIVPFIIFQALPFWSLNTRIIVTAVWLAFLVIDVLDIMSKLKMDERERKHEAISERNSLWVIIIILAVGFVYRTLQSIQQSGTPEFDWLIAGALIAGLVVKAVSNIYLDRKD